MNDKLVETVEDLLQQLENFLEEEPLDMLVFLQRVVDVMRESEAASLECAREHISTHLKDVSLKIIHKHRMGFFEAAQDLMGEEQFFLGARKIIKHVLDNNTEDTPER